MNIWREWRGSRAEWSWPTKVIVVLVTVLLVVVWAIAIEYVQRHV